MDRERVPTSTYDPVLGGHALGFVAGMMFMIIDDASLFDNLPLQLGFLG